VLFESMVEQGARLPSARRYEARERAMRDGVLIPKKLYRDLCDLLPKASST
jgi:delta1-piperideine-2-carboxylate reductase